MGLVSGIITIATSIAAARQADMMKGYERQQAQAAKEAAETQARANDRQAAYKERLERDRNRRRLALNRARIGATGIDYSGTPLLVEVENAINMEMDVLNERNRANDQSAMIRWQGNQQARQHLMNANAYGAKSDQYGLNAVAGVFNTVEGAVTLGKTGYTAYEAIDQKGKEKGWW